MSRFLSKHDIKKNERLLNEDLLLNASKYKIDLKNAISNENHRINIDSAKKRAVNQGMNYDGFHQMVLGADLKGVKTSELLEFKPKGIIMNTVMTQNILSKEHEFLAGNFVPGKGKEDLLAQMNLLDLNNPVHGPIKLKETYRNLKKSWKTLKTMEDKVNLILQNRNFEELLNCDILDSDFFLEILSNVGSYILSEKNIEKQNLFFLLECLDSTLNHEYASKLKKFIGKKHKAIYADLKEKKIFDNLTDENLENNNEDKIDGQEMVDSQIIILLDKIIQIIIN